MPCLASASYQSYILNDLANTYGGMGREEEALTVYEKGLQLDLEEGNWSNAGTGLRNLHVTFHNLHRRAEGMETLSLARELAEAAENENGRNNVVHAS